MCEISHCVDDKAIISIHVNSNIALVDLQLHFDEMSKTSGSRNSKKKKNNENTICINVTLTLRFY